MKIVNQITTAVTRFVDTYVRLICPIHRIEYTPVNEKKDVCELCEVTS